MSVGLLTKEYPPDVYGGAGVYVENLARELSRLLDVEVHCFGGQRDDPLVSQAHAEWEGIAGKGPHIAALRTMSADLSMAAALSEVDLVHSNTWYTNFAGHLAKLLYGVPHVATTHSLEPLRPWKAEQLGGGYELSMFCERTGLENADALIAVSGEMRNDILRCYSTIDPSRVHVVHNGVDPQVYKADPSTDVLERYGIEPGSRIVIFVGRITRQKGIVHLLRAASRIAPDALLLLCASSPDTSEIGEETAALVDNLSSTRGNVLWLKHMLGPNEIVQLLSHSTVFVCPSVYEPFGLVNLEAMACETAVVATRTGGIPEIVLEGKTGLLVDPPSGRDYSGFEERLADAINELLSDSERAGEMGRAGRGRVVEEFSWHAVAQKTRAVYESVSSTSGDGAVGGSPLT